jgi:Protein of unknown function (DUF433)
MELLLRCGINWIRIRETLCHSYLLFPNSSIIIEAETALIAVDLDGVVRIGKTRVTLGTVVAAFNQGATAEEIVYRYPANYPTSTAPLVFTSIINRPSPNIYSNDNSKPKKSASSTNKNLTPKELRDRLLARRNEKLVC